MYKIKINYRTGNSFGSSDEEQYLELEWKTEKAAQENLKRIEEHWERYELLESQNSWDWYGAKEKKASRLKELDKKDFVVEGASYGYGHHQICLFTDGGEKWQFWCFWCGYFESLYGASVEEDKPSNSFTTGRR